MADEKSPLRISHRLFATSCLEMRISMKKDLLHTPEGVRDIYNGECARKIVLQNRLHDVCALYGYNDIQTPSFEFFDVFNKDVEVFHRQKCLSFLTGMEIHWCCARI